MHVLAIETGGTKLQMAIGNIKGDILYNHRQAVVPQSGHLGTLAAIEDSMPIIRAKAEELGVKIERIGIGFGGIVSTNEKKLVTSSQISGWENFPLEAYLTEKTGIPTRVYNDANAATWGEYILGTGHDSNIFMYANIGSGVGGGIVINGKLYNGQGLGALEVGQCFVYNPFSDNDNSYIQLERICSGWGLESRLRKSDLPKDSVLRELCGNDASTLNCKMLGEAARQNDAFANKFLDDSFMVFSIHLANIISLFSPDVVAIGGGVSLIGDPVFNRIRAFVEPYVAKNVQKRYKIVPCALEEDIVIAGALLLAGRDDQI